MTAPKKKRVRKPKGPLKTRWEKSADRENDRRRKKASLFVHAGIVPLATPAEREAKFGGAREEAERSFEEDRIRRERRGAELEERGRGWPSEEHYYGFILEEMAREARGGSHAKPIEVPAAPPAPPQAVQTPLFMVLPTGAEVAAVVEGKAIPQVELAAEHGVDLSAPMLIPAKPCPDCGWFPLPPEKSKTLDLHVHPPGCPGFRAFLLGMSENCPDCKAHHARIAGAPRGACEVHHARCLACAHEGCIPGPAPARWSYASGEFCQRCWISMRAPPYLRPEEKSAA